MSMVAWNVYLSGKLIDTVYFTKSCDAEYVRKSLIDYDGYHYLITVEKKDDPDS